MGNRLRCKSRTKNNDIRSTPSVYTSSDDDDFLPAPDVPLPAPNVPLPAPNVPLPAPDVPLPAPDVPLPVIDLGAGGV